MDHLHELSDKLDNIKEKLTDNEYKDLMELTQKIYKKDKRVKLVQLDIEVLAFTKYDSGETHINNIADYGYFNDNNDEDDDDYHKLEQIYIHKPKIKPRIIELNIVDQVQCRPVISVEKNYIEEPFYDKLKEDKYKVYDQSVFIYLGETST